MCYTFSFSALADFFHQNHSHIRKEVKGRALQTAVFTPGLKEK